MQAILRTAGLVIMVILAMAVVSCGPAASSGPVKIQVMVGFGGGTDPTQQPVHEALVSEFNSTIGKEKGIELEIFTVNNADAVQKFTTLVAGGMTPDICGPIGVSGVANFIDEWMDLAPFLAKDNYDLSAFDPAILKAHVYAMPDGSTKQIGLPIGIYPSVLFYNKDIFDRAELPYPPTSWGDPAWTYDKLHELARKMTFDANGKTPNDAGYDVKTISQVGFAGTHWAPWRALIAKFFHPDGRPATLGMSPDYKTAEMNSKAWQDAFTYLEKQVHKDQIRPKEDPNAGAAIFGDGTPMGSGKVAMWEIFSWIGYDFPTWDAGFKWDIAPVPSMNGKIVSATNSDIFTITKSSKNQDKAWEVYKWLFSPENYKRLSLNYGGIPAIKSLQDDWLKDRKEGVKDAEGNWVWGSEPRPDLNWEVMLGAGAYADSPNHEAWVPAYTKVWDAMNKAMTAVITGGYTSIGQLTTDLNTEVQTYLDEYWAAQK